MVAFLTVGFVDNRRDWPSIIHAFSLRLDLSKEVNRHFLENDYSDLSFFSVVLN